MCVRDDIGKGVLSCVSGMISERVFELCDRDDIGKGVFIFLGLFVDDSLMSLEKLNVEIL